MRRRLVVPTRTPLWIIVGIALCPVLRLRHGCRSCVCAQQSTPAQGGAQAAEIKLMKDDAAAVEQQADDIKARYTKYFKV